MAGYPEDVEGESGLMALFDFIYSIPDAAWLGAGCLAVGAAYRLFGARVAKTVAAVVTVFIANRIGRRQGWDAITARNQANEKAVLEVSSRARNKSRERNSDPDRLREDDGFKRH